MQEATTVLREARRLYKMGAAVLWLHPNSKRPVKTGWTTGKRDSWKTLMSEYQEGMNVGVRLGDASQLAEGKYLCVVDVDVKSDEKRHRQEAREAVARLLGEPDRFPEVRSGRGGGSRHYYCVTDEPFQTFNPAGSEESVRARVPSKNISKKDREELSEKELKEGWRMVRAWEISLYSKGRQVVIPPSRHPDTGALYAWKKPWEGLESLPRLTLPARNEGKKKNEHKTIDKSKKGGFTTQEDDFDFLLDDTLDIRWLPEVPEMTRKLIEKGLWRGVQVSDRSAYLLLATVGLCSAGLSPSSILSILTDRGTFLGECAFEHAQTQDRRRAARWLWNYTVRKVVGERDPRKVFEGVPVERPKELGEEDAAWQKAQLENDAGWTRDLIRSGQNGDGPPKSTLTNVELVLTKAVGPLLFQRDLFAYRDVYGCEAPWGAKPGQLVQDDDIPQMKAWFGKTYGFEPPKDMLYDAVVLLSCQNAFDPVKDWLERLPKWDGVKRLDTWLREHFEAEGPDEYLAQVFRKWMVAMVMRIYEPGAKFDWMPIFEGAQGVGKSSFGRLLVGDAYFLDWLPNLADKDSALALQGAWAVEMGELATMRKNELETVKAYLTRTVDKFRPPFGRKLLESPRRCVFYGTTNRETYLRDETGNRRLKPLKVGRLDFEALKRDREQLFAEARALYFTKKEEWKTGLDLVGEAKRFELEIQGEKMVEDEGDLMAEEILECLENEESDFDFSKFKMSDLFGGTGPLNRWKFDARNSQFASRALKKLGGKSWKSRGRKYWKVTKRLGGGVGDRSERGPIPLDFY